MSRYIDIEPYDSCLIVANSEDSGIECKDIPTADVQHGEWINEEMHCGLVYRQCNQCNKVTEDYLIEECEGAYRIVAPYYCGYCGARMDGGAE